MKYKIITIKMSEEQFRKLKSNADKNNRSISGEVRNMIDESKEAKEN